METLQARAERLMESAEAASANGDNATAAAAAEEAADAYRTLGQGPERADALVRVGGARFGLGEFESSVTAYRTAGAIAEDSGLVDLQAFALWGQADGLARLGQWDDVEDTTRRGIALMRAYGHDTWLPGTQLLLGKALYFMDMEAEALGVLEEARQGYRARGAVADVSRVDDFTVDVLLFLEDFERAATVAARCLGASHALADPLAEAYAERRMGQVHLTAGDAAIAVDHFVRARDAYRGNNRSASAATCDVWLARAYHHLGRDEESVASTEKPQQHSMPLGGTAHTVRRWTSSEHPCCGKAVSRKRRTSIPNSCSAGPPDRRAPMTPYGSASSSATSTR